jgi:signal transduction histidine kinase
LSIAKEAVEALGGAIVLESELDKGTRVLIRLPVARIVS